MWGDIPSALYTGSSRKPYPHVASQLLSQPKTTEAISDMLSNGTIPASGGSDMHIDVRAIWTDPIESSTRASLEVSFGRVGVGASSSTN